jgi:two-component system chemotaxis sensor kinase CheA
MAKKSDEFLKRLLETFQGEAEEHVKATRSGLLELEKTPTPERQAEIVEAIFREAHSLKGAARAVEMTEIETICQSLESLMAALKRKEIEPSSALLDVLHEGVDGIERILSLAHSPGPQAEIFKVEKVVEILERAAKGTLPEVARETKIIEVGPAERPVSPEAVRISVAKLDSLLLQAEELLPEKLSLADRAAKAREIRATLGVWKREWTKLLPSLRAMQRRIHANGEGSNQGNVTKKNPEDVRFLEFLDWSNGMVRTAESQLEELTKLLDQDRRSLVGKVDNLLGDMKKVLMLPFGWVLEIFPRLVRDLSRDRGKEVDLIVQGADLEIDKRVLEVIKDPLIHLVRNSIDHGIEKPEERIGKGKPARGTIKIAGSYKEGGKAEVLISDDGAGMDTQEILNAALKLGLVSPEEANLLDDERASSFAFESGVSTSPMITDLSGRGIGLAIVREKIENLNGFVGLETSSGAGTTFRLLLPLTLATFRGTLVRVGEHLFIFPSVNIERVERVPTKDIKTAENKETIELEGRAVSLVHLENLLALPHKNAADESPDHVYVVIIGSAEKRIAFLVDQVLQEQEVLIKSLGKQLSRVRNVAGATILGTGRVVPIVNVADLMKSALAASSAVEKPVRVTAEGATARRKSVLVVEDSITARTLLKSILESAGYEVKTAVDGVDGFTQLRAGAFDIVVSDVDMPRMSGFDLTAKVRSDKELFEVPVVLVTALHSREDRERGMDVGANAYIVKSSFDQTSLLEVIKRLA